MADVALPFESTAVRHLDANLPGVKTTETARILSAKPSGHWCGYVPFDRKGKAPFDQNTVGKGMWDVGRPLRLRLRLRVEAEA